MPGDRIIVQGSFSEFHFSISINQEVRILTVWIFGRDLVGDLRWITSTDRVDGTNSDDVLLLGFDSIVNPERELLDGSAVDPEPFQLRPGLGHLHVVAGDRGAAVFGRRLPGDIDVLPAGVRDSDFKRRRRGTWRDKMPVHTSDMLSVKY